VGQADLLAKYGGVHPSAAAAAHAAAIDGVVDAALKAAGVAGRDVSAVAITLGPGLSLCLNVGVRKARSLSRALGAPLVPVHHMEAHALVARMPAAVAAAAAAATTTGGAGGGSSNSSSSNSNTASSPSSSAAAAAASAPQFPFLVLLVSGGHNLLLLARGVGEYVQLGSTLDDALGEAYDKVARMLGLVAAPHGGAALEALARRGDPLRYPLPVPMKRRANCDFSFAGLKTSARMCIERELAPLEEGTPGAFLFVVVGCFG
jgi:tRNA A37 threonylcarbamoyltransferase TsaD